MTKRTVIWLLTATSLVGIGMIVFAIAMSVCHWDFTKLSTVKYKTDTYEIGEEFSNITVNTDTADILFAVSEDGKSRVVCHDPEKVKHSVEVKDGTLIIKRIDSRKWQDYIGINFDSSKVTVFLSKTEYAALSVKESTGDMKIPKDFRFASADISVSTGNIKFLASVSESVKIKTSTGDISVQNSSVGTLDLSVSTGTVTVSDVECKNIRSSGSTGDIFLKNVKAAEKISVKRSTGEVRFDRSDAAGIFVKTSTGDVTGTLLSEKVFITETSTGRINVPKTVAGGKCEIKTSTGDIKMRISA